jgi:catechol 2,3-dioxygenase-like lactoylglutathione lyase family enzyme
MYNLYIVIVTHIKYNLIVIHKFVFYKMNITKFGIHIKVKDINKSYNFYKSFGLKAIFTYGNTKWIGKIKKDFPNTPNAPEKYEGVTFDIGTAVLEIANGHICVKPEVFKLDITSSKISAMVDADSIDEIVKICKKNNYKIAVGPKEFYWGTREVVIKDPDGFVLVFREPIKK